MFNDKTILITGGTGSLGNRIIDRILLEYKPKKIIVYSRDEFKQFIMQNRIDNKEDILRYFIGDVRDYDRLYRAMKGVDIVIHTAALKQVPSIEYNPIEAVKTNINGAINVIDAAINRDVKKVVALSTDKACCPINLYGATKLISDKLFISGNSYAGGQIKLSVVRYGNVSGSRGSIIPYFKNLLNSGVKEFPITDFRMTRFWITLDEGVDLVFKAVNESEGGEIYVSKIPSFKIIDLARAISEDVQLKETGIRPGEKLHETMIAEEDSRSTYEYDKHYIIYPQLEWWDYKIKNKGKKVNDGFIYKSDKNINWLNMFDLKEKVKNI